MKLITIFISTFLISSASAKVYRPNLEISVKTHFFCNKSIHNIPGGKYYAFCRQFYPGDKLVVIYDPSEKVLLNSSFIHGRNYLGTLDNWCNDEIAGSDFVGPACKFSVNEVGKRVSHMIDAMILKNSNVAILSVTPDLFEREKSYIIKLVEYQSGSNVETMPFVATIP